MARYALGTAERLGGIRRGLQAHHIAVYCRKHVSVAMN